jgi:hypothetical protein
VASWVLPAAPARILTVADRWAPVPFEATANSTVRQLQEPTTTLLIQPVPPTTSTCQLHP